ncbi:MAG: transposase [Planctomycetes bacterium]|nr:transposase [Planctomycetota bacterium]
MPRTVRHAPGGMIFHVLNRGNARDLIFDKQADYAAFEKALAETQAHVSLRILSDCLMRNHWHLVLWPLQDGDLGRFMQRLPTPHVRRRHPHRQTVGTGHLYQGTYKSFPIEEGDHLYTVLRYVERNPVRPTLVDRAENWQWSSLWRWEHPAEHADRPTLCPWPIPRPADWIARVNRTLTKKELEAVRASVVRGRPFGSEAWQESTAKQLGLESTFRSRGRPRKATENNRA